MKNIKIVGDQEHIVQRMAALTPGLSGAQIASVCNEAALHAAREAKKDVEQSDFEFAVDRVILGLCF